ncbi:hypothetical protein JN531_004495 [Flagellatimonas centrodinii]|uniref:hypothetical protein n=1 Tax=Flagellatimonas centrodinii TaxID=2806210 RepID=UPI001FEE439B|nr:hypothetical protein [Flagellatimonas centrodinii]ULQ47547.1 hypothetical protein JN531_004495 [Flagellatimonas centrodinii]
MEIKVEVHVTPEELRRFLGLPDVGGLQDDIIDFLRGKVGAASEFDASEFVKQNLETLRKSPAWKKIISKVVIADAEAAPAAPRKRRRSTGNATGTGKAGRRKRDGEPRR